MKKLISVLLSLVMLFSVAISINATTAATTEPEREELTYGNNTYFINDDGTATVTGLNTEGSVNVMTVPSAINGKVVTAIGDEAFYAFSSLVKLTLPPTLKSIGMGAFAGCYQLKILTLPDGLETIGDGAFASCVSVEEVVLPDSVKDVGAYAFTGCTSLKNVTLSKGMNVILDSCFDGDIALKSIEIPPNILYISHGAFGNTGLESFTIPKTVNSIGSYVFRNCDSLTAIQAEDGNGAAKSVDGVLYSLDGTTLVAYPAGKADTNFEFPTDITTVGAYSFYGADNITEINLPENVTTLGDAAFVYCKNLSKINFSSKITAIPQGCFSDCSALKAIDIPDTISTVGELAFFYCENLKSIAVPASVGSIGARAFGYYEVLNESTGESSPALIEGVNIFAQEGTAAEKYAKDNNIMLNYQRVGMSSTDILLLVLGILLIVIAICLAVYILKRAFKAKKAAEEVEQAPSVLGDDE